MTTGQESSRSLEKPWSGISHRRLLGGLLAGGAFLFAVGVTSCQPQMLPWPQVAPALTAPMQSGESDPVIAETRSVVGPEVLVADELSIAQPEPEVAPALPSEAPAHVEPTPTPAATVVPGNSEEVEKVFGLSRRDASEVYLMVTKDHALPSWYEPTDLVRATDVGLPAPNRVFIRGIIVADTREMFAAAARDGIHLRILSGFRSYAYQEKVFAYWLATAKGDVEEASRQSARPGHSQHQLGTTIDINWLDPNFARTREGRWLWANAHRFGFIFPYTPEVVARTGYIAEPWHIRWVGRELAQDMVDRGYQHSADVTPDEFVAQVREMAGLQTVDAIGMARVRTSGGTGTE